MHRPPKYRRKAWRRTKPTAVGFRPPWSNSLRSSDDPSARFSRKETIIFAVFGIVAFVGAIIIFNFISDWKSKRGREEYLGRLCVNYSLTETQVAAIRGIENKYHGTGAVFFRPSHTYEEEADHQITISRQMPPDAAARFLADQQNHAPTIGRRRH